MKTTALVVVTALAMGANLLRAQDDPGAVAESHTTVIVNGGPADGGVVVPSGGVQTLRFDAKGTNGFDVEKFSKAIQDGMKQAFGNGGSNMFSGGKFDPARMMQDMNNRALENVREGLGFTDETEWSVVKPLVEKVIKLQQESESAAQQLRSRRFFGGNNPFMSNLSAGAKLPGNPEQSALQQAVDDNASSAQMREAIAKYRAAQKEQQAELEAAQATLRKVLTTKQEAQAILLGLLS